jgi:dihydroorotase
MTLYLTDATSPAEVARARASGFVHAFKYYPAGATTNSESGVTRARARVPAHRGDGARGVVLAVHGEVTDPDVDMFDRERVFVERHLRRSSAISRAAHRRRARDDARGGATSSRAAPPHRARRSRRST